MDKWQIIVDAISVGILWRNTADHCKRYIWSKCSGKLTNIALGITFCKRLSYNDHFMRKPPSSYVKNFVKHIGLKTIAIHMVTCKFERNKFIRVEFHITYFLIYDGLVTECWAMQRITGFKYSWNLIDQVAVRPLT